MKSSVIILALFFATSLAKGQVLNGIYVFDTKTNTIDVHAPEGLDYLGFKENSRGELCATSESRKIWLLTKVEGNFYIKTEVIHNLEVARKLAKEPKKEWQINLIIIKNLRP